MPALLHKWASFIAKKLGRSFDAIAADEIAKHEYAGQQQFDSFGDCVFTVYVTQPVAK